MDIALLTLIIVWNRTNNMPDWIVQMWKRARQKQEGSSVQVYAE